MKSQMKILSFILVTLLLSCAYNTNKNTNTQTRADNNHTTVYSDATKNDSSYVFTGFYFLANNGQGIRMQKDHSDEIYNISKTPFVSINNILRATAQKNVIQGRDTYGITIVLDNPGAKDLEQETGNPSHQYIAVVIANRLLYVVENTSQIKTGIMQIILVDYSEKEVSNMIDAINEKR
jgi:hypothetical protein